MFLLFFFFGTLFLLDILLLVLLNLYVPMKCTDRSSILSQWKPIVIITHSLNIHTLLLLIIFSTFCHYILMLIITYFKSIDINIVHITNPSFVCFFKLVLHICWFYSILISQHPFIIIVLRIPVFLGIHFLFNL